MTNENHVGNWIKPTSCYSLSYANVTSTIDQLRFKTREAENKSSIVFLFYFTFVDKKLS